MNDHSRKQSLQALAAALALSAVLFAMNALGKTTGALLYYSGVLI